VLMFTECSSDAINTGTVMIMRSAVENGPLAGLCSVCNNLPF
jgi:hypothetical protein